MMSKICKFLCALTLCTGMVNALTFNETNVNTQFQSIIAPTADQTLIINALNSLSGAQLAHALETLSGEQYTTIVDASQYADRRFSRRIFDGVRNLLPPSCETDCCDLQLWFSGEGGRSFLRGNINTKGYKSDNFDFAIGAHTYLTPDLFVGTAANYEEDQFHFNLGGHNKMYSGQGAFYGAYSNSCFYLYSNLILGYSHSHLKREINFASIVRETKADPKGFHGRFYAEGALNYTPFGMLVQPFFGVAAGFYRLEAIKEFGGNSIALNLHHKHANPVSTFLGLHLKNSVLDGVSLGVDVAWEHCFDVFKHTDDAHTRFRQFGSTFTIDGCHQGRDGIVGAVNVNVEFADGLQFYTGLSGELWDHWAAYGYNAGINFWW